MVSTVAPTSYALAKLQLDKSTPLSVQTFVIKFTSAIGPTHAAVLRKALADNNLNPTGTRDIAQHTAIYDLLINCLPDAMDVLAVTNECACLGPKSVDWLLRNYAPTTTASAIVTLIELFSEPLGDDVSAGLTKKSILNASLPDSCKLPDAALATFILMLLPANLNTVRDIIVERDALPTISELEMKVKNVLIMQSKPRLAMNDTSGSAMAFASRKGSGPFCCNCDTSGHRLAECPKPKSKCDTCGVGAGHMTKHCLVMQYDRPFPASMVQSTRDRISAQRDEYKKSGKLAGAVLIMHGHSEVAEDDDNFWEMLARENEAGLYDSPVFNLCAECDA